MFDNCPQVNTYIAEIIIVTSIWEDAFDMCPFKYIREKIGCFSWIILFSIVLIVFLFIFFDFEPIFKIFQKAKSPKTITIVDDYTVWYYFLVVFITGLIAYITWSQFHKTNNSLRTECLLKMDERFGSPEILKARAIIHQIYRSNRKEKTSKKKAVEMTSKEIIRLSKSEIQKEQNKFFKILSLLDFLDTVGFLHLEGYLSKDKYINTLFDPYLDLYLNVFDHYVYELETPKFYESFRKFRQALN